MARGDGERTRGLNGERRKAKKGKTVVGGFNLNCSNKRNTNWEINGERPRENKRGARRHN